MPKLSQEDIVTIETLKSKGKKNTEIAEIFGVTEGAVRYHLKRAEEGATDGRQGKEMKAEAYAEEIEEWVRTFREVYEDASIHVRELHDYLVLHHDYEGSYKSVLRYVRKTYPEPEKRPFRRVETPPGAQMQADWAEYSGIDVGEGPQTLYAFFLTLSHSRHTVVIWAKTMEQMAWHHCHNEAFRRLGGVAAINRIDNLKTGVATGTGSEAEINPAYLSYARTVGFHVDPCEVASPRQKGKVERRIGILERKIHPGNRTFGSLAELQAWTDERLERWARRATCPATGKTVWETFQDEQAYLRPLGTLPEPFDVAVTRRVHRDCTVNFESRTYSVPYAHWGGPAEVRGQPETIQILVGDEVVAEHPRHTEAPLQIRPEHYEEDPDCDRPAPPPLGAVGQVLEKLDQDPVEYRSVDYYAELMEELS